ncbi:oxidoreductase [Flavobacterium sp. GN10]|uniref:Oxidoreductase n=1 Tax=Flavobacterium tagetis TaxID=2801336 RepID=A0ABS1KEK2_9FLAO|nr:oxidoreductase [Flavobacterium tagetis]MBL0736581.1 oxidoreductase [Flavobacterium tagetis]
MTTRSFFLSTAFLILLSACNKKENTTTTTLPEVTEQAETETDTLQAEEASKKESIYLFNVIPKDSSEVAFVSLSDIYPVTDEKDTLVLPNIEKMGKYDSQYFTFVKNYRKRFLSKTNISETDSLFIYDYAKNKQVSFAVKNLKTAAMLNGYSSEEDWPYDNYDFMIGFEINKKHLNGFSEYYRDALVYVGKENPFSQEHLKPISWKKIAKKDYPSKPLKNDDRTLLKNTLTGNTYFFKTESYEYFLQDYLDSNKIIYGRRLLVVNSKTKDVIIEKLFSQSEGTSPSPLNYENGENSIDQWTGKLFKNKPEVVFGFEYVSFGCPSISVIDKSNEEINIQCDNRH